MHNDGLSVMRLAQKDIVGTQSCLQTSYLERIIYDATRLERITMKLHLLMFH